MTTSTGPPNRPRELHPMGELAVIRRHLERLVLHRHHASVADEDAYAELAEREMEILLRRTR